MPHTIKQTIQILSGNVKTDSLYFSQNDKHVVHKMHVNGKATEMLGIKIHSIRILYAG